MNFLASLLESDHPLFAKTIADLERASGGSGVDTRLIADITERAHEVMRGIGIDPSDTSAEELYHALITIVEKGNLTLLGNTQYVLISFAEGPVSFNLLDVIESAHHQLPFSSRSVGHAQRNLRLEVIRRYAEHDRTSDELVHNLAELAGLKPEQDQHFKDVDSTVNSIENSDDAPSILMIGDIFTDAFIKLSEDVAIVEKDEDGSSWVKIPFGGRPPYEEVEVVQSVGPAPNAAVSSARLGLNVSLMTWLGDDKAGNDSLANLHNEGVSPELIKQKQNAKSNYYYVLRVGAERTILTKNEEYEYNWIKPAAVPDWIYLASSSKESWQLHVDLLAYLTGNPEITFVFQPGTFHFVWGKEKLKDLYARANVIILNKEEAADVTGEKIDDIAKLAKALCDLGPNQAVITDGPNGSYAYYDEKLVRMPNYPDPAPPYDRTGAGDAFASTVVAALALGESMETALSWAPINSMSVVQKLGAQAGLLKKEQILELLDQSPEDYKITEL